jgi:hypothetical protein
VSIHNKPGKFLQVRWIKEVIKPDDLVKWAGLAGVTAGSDGTVERSAGGSGWNAGAYSERAITRVGDTVAGISAVAADTGAHMMIGLNDKSVTNSYSDINYALYADRGTVRVYESGRHIKNFGKYSAGEAFQVQVNKDGKVEYLQDGNLLYTSRVSPTFPLWADVSIHNKPGKFLQVRWIREVVKPDDSQRVLFAETFEQGKKKEDMIQLHNVKDPVKPWRDQAHPSYVKLVNHAETQAVSVFGYKRCPNEKPCGMETTSAGLKHTLRPNRLYTLTFQVARKHGQAIGDYVVELGVSNADGSFTALASSSGETAQDELSSVKLQFLSDSKDPIGQRLVIRLLDDSKGDWRNTPIYDNIELTESDP